jgi:hypothetical protein
MKRPTRMEQLGNLLTAMIAVIVGGSSDLTTDLPSPDFEALASNDPVLPTNILCQFKPGRRCMGAVAEIAHEQNVCWSTVRKVLYGQTINRTIMAAVLRKIAERCGAESLRSLKFGMPVRKKHSPFCIEEVRKFRHSGPYFKVKKDVAHRFGVQLATVSDVISGKSKTHRILTALRDGIKEIENCASDSPIGSDINNRRRPFSDEVCEQFLRGGRYNGLQTKIANDLGISIKGVSGPLHGRTISKRILEALQTEMARVDAELAAKNGGR